VSLDWYEENIEPEVRDLVRYLRNNGINTECSCGHEMYIQCQFILDGTMYDIHRHMFNYYYENGLEMPNYEIIGTHKHLGGCFYSSIDIRLLPKGTI
jgi:hypothetical protein